MHLFVHLLITFLTPKKISYWDKLSLARPPGEVLEVGIITHKTRLGGSKRCPPMYHGSADYSLSSI